MVDGVVNKYATLVQMLDERSGGGGEQQQGGGMRLGMMFHAMRRFMIEDRRAAEDFEYRARMHPRGTQMMVDVIQDAIRENGGGRVLGMAEGALSVDTLFMVFEMTKRIKEGVEAKLVAPSVTSADAVYPFVSGAMVERAGVENERWDAVILDGAAESLESDVGAFAKDGTFVVVFNLKSTVRIQDLLADRELLMRGPDFLVVRAKRASAS